MITKITNVGQRGTRDVQPALTCRRVQPSVSDEVTPQPVAGPLWAEGCLVCNFPIRLFKKMATETPGQSESWGLLEIFPTQTLWIEPVLGPRYTKCKGSPQYSDGARLQTLPHHPSPGGMVRSSGPHSCHPCVPTHLARWTWWRHPGHNHSCSLYPTRILPRVN